MSSKLIPLSLAFFAASAAFATPATGWLQTAAGTYDFNDTANWVDGEINGVFGSDLTLTGAQTITFDTDTTLPNGLSFAFTGNYKVKLQSADETSIYTLTLGGDFLNDEVGSSASVEPQATINFDLGGATRTIRTAAGNTVINGVISNGGLIIEGEGQTRLCGANTFEGGVTDNASGYLFIGHSNALGTGPFVLCANAMLNTPASAITIATDNPITINGNVTFWGSKDLNLGKGALTINAPAVIDVGKNKMTLGGQVAENSPYGIDALSKGVNNGALETAANLVVNDEATLDAGTNQKWTFKGTISGSGVVNTLGNFELVGSCVDSTSISFRVKTGYLRFMAKDIVPDTMKILIDEGAVFADNSTYGYTLATALPLIDPRSTGVFGISCNQKVTDLDMSAYPNLSIGAFGDNRKLTGTLIPPASGVYKLGGGGKTLYIDSADLLAAGADVDASAGSLQISASQNLFNGTVTLDNGYNITMGSGISAPAMSVVCNGGTVRLASAAAGEFNCLSNITLNTATLLVDLPSGGDTTHNVAGEIKIGTYNNGVSQIILTNGNAYASVLHAKRFGNAHDAEMVKIYNKSGEAQTKFLLDETPAMIGTGSLGTTSAPVIPFARIIDELATYESGIGVRAINSSEYVTLTAPNEAAALTAGANIYIDGSDTISISSSETINALRLTGDQTLAAADGVAIKIASGAVDVTSAGAARLDAPLDFGNRHGYISGASSKFYNLYSPIAGTAGITISDMNSSLGSSGPNLYNLDSTYSGDTYITGLVYPKGDGVVPNGTTNVDGTVRSGDLYLYGRYGISVSSGSTWTIHLNGLYGNGTYQSNGSGWSNLYLGYCDADGDFSGTIGGGGKKVNFSFRKYGKGKQRLTGSLGGKSSGTIMDGGELQIDGASNIGDSNGHFIIENGTLSGCGTISPESTCGTIQMKTDGVFAPGSDEYPGVAMTLGQNFEINGGSMRFTVNNNYASQAVLVDGCSLTGSLSTIPVVVNSTATKSVSYKLLEADSFGGKTFALDKAASVGGGNISVKKVLAADGETVEREQLWYVRNSGLMVLFR